MTRRIAVGFLSLAAIYAIWLLVQVQPVRADHGLVRCGNTGLAACLLYTSPFVEKHMKARGEVTYCVDARGAQYPGFAASVDNVMVDYAKKLGVPHRLVAMPASRSDTSCSIRHEMLDNHSCSACGAHIFVSNYPLVVEYNAKAGILRFDSVIGHEAGHGYCLLDEHYDKVNFRSYILNYGRWIHDQPTVMDSGTPFLSAYSPLGIWYLTEYDLERCSETLGRDLDVPACTGDPCWTGTDWLFADGWRFKPNSGCGEWTDPKGRLIWGSCDPSWGGRYNVDVNLWFCQMGQDCYFDPDTGLWYSIYP